MSFDEQPDGDIHGECAEEINRLNSELDKAWRCIVGLHNKMSDLDKLGAMGMYHSPTVAAARRHVYEGKSDGAEYFIGKPVDILHAALKLGEKK